MSRNRLDNLDPEKQRILFEAATEMLELTVKKQYLTLKY